MSADCHLWAEAPWVNVGEHEIIGVGHRACDGVQGAVPVTVRLRQHRWWWPDKTLRSRTLTTDEAAVTVIYKCSGTGSQEVFTEIIVQGKKAKSLRANITLCS